MNKLRLEKEAKFFEENLGSVQLETAEKSLQQLKRRARQLANAEILAFDLGLTFHWSIDNGTDSRDWSDELPYYKAWVCEARDRKGSSVDFLGGIDFGNGGEPWGNPYMRIVQAEMAERFTSVVQTEEG